MVVFALSVLSSLTLNEEVGEKVSDVLKFYFIDSFIFNVLIKSIGHTHKIILSNFNMQET